MSDECIVTSKTGVSSPFDPGRLIFDLTSCFGHAPTKASQAYWLEQTIEDRLLAFKRLTLSTYEITAVSHAVLFAFDKLAGDQYAARHHKLLS